MKVSHLMRRVPRSCGPDNLLVEAGRTMADTGVGVLPVVDEERRVTGVLTDRDICCALSRSSQPLTVRVAAVASTPPWTCRPTDELTAALALMREHAVHRLPVVDEEGRLEGLLSLDEVVLAAHLLAGPKIEGPVYAEVVETLKAIVRPATALVEVGAAAPSA